MFNNLYELLEEKVKIVSLKYEYEKTVEELYDNKKNSKSKNKSYWTPIIKDYERDVNKYQEEENKINNLIIKLSTYSKELIIPFILKCISLIEGENYVYRTIILTNSTNIITLETMPVFNNVDIIFPESLLEQEMKLEKAFYISVLPTTYIEFFGNYKSKYVMMPSKGYIDCLSCDLYLNYYFNNFPYLEVIFMDLINRRLKEPNKSLKNILEDELTSLKEEKIKDLRI